MLKNRKKNETELKNTDTKIKNILKEIKSRLDNTGEWISDLVSNVYFHNIQIMAQLKRKGKEKKNHSIL